MFEGAGAIGGREALSLLSCGKAPQPSPASPATTRRHLCLRFWRRRSPSIASRSTPLVGVCAWRGTHATRSPGAAPLALSATWRSWRPCTMPRSMLQHSPMSCSRTAWQSSGTRACGARPGAASSSQRAVAAATARVAPRSSSPLGCEHARPPAHDTTPRCATPCSGWWMASEAPHGAAFQRWAGVLEQRCPEIGDVSQRCHTYESRRASTTGARVARTTATLASRPREAVLRPLRRHLYGRTEDARWRQRRRRRSRGSGHAGVRGIRRGAVWAAASSLAVCHYQRLMQTLGRQWKRLRKQSRSSTWGNRTSSSSCERQASAHHGEPRR